MKLLRMVAAVALVAVLVGVAYVGQATESAGAKMTAAAQKFLDTLTAEQKAKATFAFDDKERTGWYFTPRQDKTKKPIRKGLPLEDMNDKQRAAALDLVRAGTSPGGYDRAATIMSLESILRELEKGGGPGRDPNWYFFSVFGAPSKAGKWGWRVEGHHLSLNFTLDSGKVAGSTPAFFGANPAMVKEGPKKGLRALPEAEDLLREVFKSLDAEQTKLALQGKQLPEIEEGKAKPNVGAPIGLPAAKMTAPQRGLLLKLVESYANRLPADIAAAEMAQVKEAGTDPIHFACAGDPAKPGNPYTYRIQGPTFVVEFLNVQNNGNHIHSAWRNIKGDFGTAGR